MERCIQLPILHAENTRLIRHGIAQPEPAAWKSFPCCHLAPCVRTAAYDQLTLKSVPQVWVLVVIYALLIILIVIVARLIIFVVIYARHII